MNQTPGRILQLLRESKGYKRDRRRFAELTGWSVDICRNLETGRTLITNQILDQLIYARWIDKGDDWWNRFESAIAEAAIGDGLPRQHQTQIQSGARRAERWGATATGPGTGSGVGSCAQPTNPFLDIGRITDPERFFDRAEVLDEIIENLRHGSSVSLVGPSEIGKSSVLSMVCAIGPVQLQLPAASFAFLNLEWVDSEGEFYDALCDVLRIEACRGYQLTRCLRGKRFVLCLDEVEKMSWDGFTVRVRSHLRGLADGSDAPLKLVIASRSPLGALFRDSPELDSPLGNICRQVSLGPFSCEKAREFIARRLAPTGVTYTEDEIDALLASSAGHPAKLQYGAAALFERHLRAKR